jgi:acetylornithine deacetylase/succinyl-diaminopimelate desuccinylase-like protein
MDVAARMQVIRELCSFDGRLAGTDAERRAANRLAERLRESGRAVEVEPTYVHPHYGLVHAVHCLLGIAGSLVAVAVPALGFGLVLFAATSMYLDLNYRLYLVRSLFFRRASQNVVARGRADDAPARLVVTAHYDAARTGAVFSAKRARRSARLAARYPWLGPFRILFWSLALLLPVLGARMAGADSDAIAALQLPQTLVLLVGLFALVDIELSAVVPAANDNASGVATALALGAELQARAPENLETWIVLPGAEECLQEGTRAFVRAHREELAQRPTHFLNLDTVGHGDVRFQTAGGWVISYAMDRRLVELAAAIADADAERDERHRARPLAHALAGDEMPPRLAGFPAISITCTGDDGYVPHYHLPSDTPENVDGEALERAHGFALELIRQLDRDVGRRSRARRVQD